MPEKQPEFDLQSAHRFFSASCFNGAWELIDKVERTEEETETMLRLSEASLWHWTRREDCTDAKRSVAYWQLSRVHALAERAADAERYGRRCLEFANSGGAPFHVAYAHEALARAAKVRGDSSRLSEHLAEARRFTEKIENEQSKERILADLSAIAS